jgi:tripartite-type tricarboxylate transporter receptor subunit TctC
LDEGSTLLISNRLCGTLACSGQIRVVLAVAAGLIAFSSAVRAQDAKTLFRTNTVRIVVGSATGGGYDLFARLIAPNLGKVLGTTVVVENQAGAGALTADQKAKFNFHITLDELRRILVVPPSMAPDRLAYHQDALKHVLTDPALIAEGERRPLYVDYRDPAQTQKLIAEVFGHMTTPKREQLKEVSLRIFR